MPGLVIDLYESKGSLDAFDQIAREEIEVAIHNLLRASQRRIGVVNDPPLPDELPSIRRNR